jgi:hypothetical protein
VTPSFFLPAYRAYTFINVSPHPLQLPIFHHPIPFISSNVQMSMYFSFSQLLFNSLYNARDFFPHIFFHFLTFSVYALFTNYFPYVVLKLLACGSPQNILDIRGGSHARKVWEPLPYSLAWRDVWPQYTTQSISHGIIKHPVSFFKTSCTPSPESMSARTYREFKTIK